ncbi:hypothetical protein HY004_01105 [Candidatus Saccharibacteria bacterium]|nr:hypothetical protein [Candidatus Saccharibacteria bacterium]
MKKNDFAAIVLIASISLLFAWFTASALIGEPKKSAQIVKTVDVISIEVDDPDKEVFKNTKNENERPINPTVERSIGKSSDSLPFN